MESSGNNQWKKDYFWNTMGSGMSAAFSVFILLIVTRLMGEYIGGIFAFSYAVAQQLQTVGQYEIRGYQSTDIREFFKFGTYLATRILTCLLMFICAVVYGLWHEATLEEAAILILVCTIKIFDAFEDVFHGMLQQHNQLYIAGRALFFRLMTTLLSFVISLYITRNLILTCCITIVCSTVALILLNIPQSRRLVSLRPAFQWNKIRGLLATCFPLFLGSFILLYLYNIPKYRMEDYLSKEFQTYYAILFMPASVVNLFSGFAFKPLLTTLAVNWTEKRIKQFVEILLKGLGIVVLLTAVISVGGYLLGIPVLSWIYGINLSQYKIELVLLLIGGGFSAASVILYYGLMVMRKQRLILGAYLFTLIISLAVSGPLIQQYGIRGASLLYGGLMLVLTAAFAVLISLSLKYKKRYTENS